jgi:hypothetical protein
MLFPYPSSLFAKSGDHPTVPYPLSSAPQALTEACTRCSTTPVLSLPSTQEEWPPVQVDKAQDAGHCYGRRSAQLLLGVQGLGGAPTLLQTCCSKHVGAVHAQAARHTTALTRQEGRPSQPLLSNCSAVSTSPYNFQI